MIRPLNNRTITSFNRAQPTTDNRQPTTENDGAGVAIKLVALMGVGSVDPVLMIDERKSPCREAFEAGSPPNPHRGMQTLAYMLAGGIAHEYSIGKWRDPRRRCSVDVRGLGRHSFLIAHARHDRASWFSALVQFACQSQDECTSLSRYYG